jgi:hypothetical protein
MDLVEIFSNKKIEYNNNTEYRKCMRDLFMMKRENYIENIERIENIDEETEDEISYDEKAVLEILDSIYLITKDNHLFNKIYRIAAAKMLSDDNSIGLAVVFSYDYFSFFSLCLVDYLCNPNDFDEGNENYSNLLKKIS